MRWTGKLVEWNTPRGFGFIAPQQGGPKVFVHVSDYPREAGIPTVGTELSFAVERDARGRKKAVGVALVGASRPLGRQPEKGTGGRSALRGWSLFSLLLWLLVLVGGWQFYQRHGLPLPSSWHREAEPAEAPAAPTQTPEPRPRFSCDSRRYCSQMTSCAEATYFLQHCPGVEMDGDGDGIPCESQWCGH